MPPKVTLTITSGNLTGQKLAYDYRVVRVLGRARDCEPRLPETRNPPKMSRYHCLLDITPPEIRLRDLGSLNGTVINGKRLGGRAKSSEDTSDGWSPNVQRLYNGDEIRISDVVIRVDVRAPAYCQCCGVEIPKSSLRDNDDTQMVVCNRCDPSVRAGAGSLTDCPICDKQNAFEAPPMRGGIRVCEQCTQEPAKIARHLVSKARRDSSATLAVLRGMQVMAEIDRDEWGGAYLMRDPSGGPPVTMRVIVPAVDCTPKTADRVLENVRPARMIHHDAMLQQLGSGFADGVFFFLSESMDGVTLREHLDASEAPMDVQKAAAITAEILDVLDLAHTLGYPGLEAGGDASTIREGTILVHRWLSPKSIVLGSDEAVKLTDLGILAALDQEGLLGSVWSGTLSEEWPRYMARQRVLDFAMPTPSTDVWAATACLYEMLTGCPPREFSSRRDPWQIVLQNDPVPVRDRNPTVPERLAQLIDQTLLDRPALLYKSAKVLREELESVV